MMKQLAFPLFAILASFIAFYFPAWLSQQKDLIIPALIVIMFCMGLTLTKTDFIRILKQPRLILTGVVLQYTIMPLAAFLLAKSLGLSNELTAGMILLGATAGGTASNVICYLAGGNVALSVTLTAVSTLLSVIATPFLTWLYLSTTIDVPASAMLLSIIKIVILPVISGLLINHFFAAKLKNLTPLLPGVAISAIVFVIAIVVALNHQRIAEVGLLIILAIVLHNLIGLLSGYWLARLLRYDESIARTIAIEVGMQNSGLSVALAMKYFGAAAALPGALFSIWHNVSGSMLAAWWSTQKRL